MFEAVFKQYSFTSSSKTNLLRKIGLCTQQTFCVYFTTKINIFSLTVAFLFHSFISWYILRKYNALEYKNIQILHWWWPLPFQNIRNYESSTKFVQSNPILVPVWPYSRNSLTLFSYQSDPILVPVWPYPRTSPTLFSYQSDPILVPVWPYPRTSPTLSSYQSNPILIP